MPDSAQSSSAVYERLLRGEASSEDYVAALRAETPYRVSRRSMDRLREVVGGLRAERDRYREALELILRRAEDAKAGKRLLAPFGVVEVARGALDQKQAGSEDR